MQFPEYFDSVSPSEQYIELGRQQSRRKLVNTAIESNTKKYPIKIYIITIDMSLLDQIKK